MIIDTEKIRKALLDKPAREAAELTGLPIKTVNNYQANENAKGYRDWKKIKLDVAMMIMERLEENEA